MRLTLIHLSDIHFSDGKNSLEARLDKLAAAISSVDPLARDYLIILSGDIANTGQRAEYEKAILFFDRLRTDILARVPGSTVAYIAVPGNHDCYLPKSEEKLRSALIAGIIPQFESTQHLDQSILDALLQKQQEYFDFSTKLCSFPQTGNKRLCLSRVMNIQTLVLRVNLYNTALVSTRNEQQGQLFVPIELFRTAIPAGEQCDLTLSVFHHPYPWLNADIATAFRNHIESFSDLAFTGHQHYHHSYSKLTSTGERLLYSEGHFLQEHDKPHTSVFSAIALDIQSNRRLFVTYRWATNQYVPTASAEWADYSRTPFSGTALRPTSQFLAILSNSGLGLTHPEKGPVALQDVFVYPDVSVRNLSEPGVQKEIRGEHLLNHLTRSSRSIFQGASFTGKTALAKMIAKDWLRERSFYPLILMGRTIIESGNDFVESLIKTETEKAYGLVAYEQFKQLPTQSRVLIIDDWDEAALDSKQSEEFIEYVSKLFGKVIFFVGGFSYMQHILERLHGSKVNLDVDLLSLSEMSHTARGALIDKWLSLDVVSATKDYSRRIEETERLIESVIGKNTLPSLAFIVLSILQAAERREDVLPDNGSFGYLYEVLITAALSLTKGKKPQLDKKYNFLAMLAFRLFETGSDMLGRAEVEKLADHYSREFKIRIDRDTLISDLLYTRVLVEDRGNLSFGYTHYFYYFLARYFKTHLHGTKGTDLRTYLNKIAMCLNSGANGIFLTFVMYLTHDEELTDKLLEIGASIFAGERPSTLTDEVEFYNSKDFAGSEATIPDSVDLADSRTRRRKLADEIRREEKRHASKDQSGLFMSEIGYSDELPTRTKVKYAVSCIEILGQILRNFTGSLPGHKKLLILETTYLLGLRTLRVLLKDIGESTVLIEREIGRLDRHKAEDKQLIKTIQKLLTIIGEMSGLSIFKMISTNVGTPDIESSAYLEVLDRIGKNSAAEMINLTIELDHYEEYPFAHLKRLYDEFKTNRFASQILKDLVIANMHVFDIGPKMRQKGPQSV